MGRLSFGIGKRKNCGKWILHSKIYSNIQTQQQTVFKKKCTGSPIWFRQSYLFRSHLSNDPSGGPAYHLYTSAVGVNDAVPFQVVHQDEGLATQRAAVRPLAAVRALVHPQAALLREPLAALATAVRSLARVRAVVYAEVGRALEVLAAHGAPEGPLPPVALLVQLELVQAAKLLAALWAHVGGAGCARCGRLGVGPPLRRRLPRLPPLRV